MKEKLRKIAKNNKIDLSESYLTDLLSLQKSNIGNKKIVKKIYFDPEILLMLEIIHKEIQTPYSDKRGNLSKMVNILLGEVLEDFFDENALYDNNAYNIFEYGLSIKTLIAINEEYDPKDVIEELLGDYKNLKMVKVNVPHSQLKNYKIEEIIEEL